MNDSRFDTNELGPHVEPDEADALDAVGERLLAERPLPRPALRAEMRARYARRAADARPAHLWRRIAAFAGSGLALIAIAALGLTGAGPLGY